MGYKEQGNDVIEKNKNIILTFSLPFILFIIGFLKKTTKFNREQLHDKLKDELEKLAKNLRIHHISERTILAVRYCLCAALDEFISLSKWGIECKWAHKALLSSIHNETWGGERFFIIMNEMLKHPKENWKVLELQYFLLCLGFEGKYYNLEREKLISIKENLLSSFSDYSLSLDDDDLSCNTVSKPDKRSSGITSFNWKVGGVLFLLILLILNGITFYKGNHVIKIISLQAKLIKDNN